LKITKKGMGWAVVLIILIFAITLQAVIAEQVHSKPVKVALSITTSVTVDTPELHQAQSSVTVISPVRATSSVTVIG